MEKKSEFILYLENILLLLLGMFCIALPLLFTNITTDFFTIPKEVLLYIVVSLGLILLSVKAIAEGSVRMRRTPFNLALLLFIVVALLSSVFAINRFDSIIAVIPLLFSVLLFFVMVNTIKNEASVLFIISSLTIGAVLVSLNTILTFYKTYILPFPFSKSQFFSPVGSLLDESLFLGLTLFLGLSIIWPLLSAKNFNNFKIKEVLFSIASLIIAIGFCFSVYKLAFIQKPPLLPYEIGFQTAMASISQDTGRVMQGFLFGSGFGTYSTDFTRFKPATINLNPNLWALTFFRSSSFALEMLATTGVLGLAAFILIITKALQHKDELKKPGRNVIFIAFFLAVIAPLLLPFSFVGYTLFFLFLAIFCSVQGIVNEERYYDVEFRLMTQKKGKFSLLSAEEVHSSKRGDTSYVLPVIVSILVVLFTIVTGFFVVRFTVSDATFQKSLIAASENNGNATYELQNSSISQFPYRDTLLRVFSGTNLDIANAIAAQQPKNASPSAQAQATINTLIQQSINAGREAVRIAPMTSANWQNFGGIYRGLIGYGQDAEQFAILAMQRAVALDPNNPQLYLDLGGIFYQLKQWDNAERQFLVAAQLKPDFANAYYNLGHALEAKGDLQNALIQYQTVRTLVANDQKATKSINEEIVALETKIGSAEQNATNQTQTQDSALQNQPPLELATPSAQLPQRTNPIDIPGPEEEPTPTPTPEK